MRVTQTRLVKTGHTLRTIMLLGQYTFTLLHQCNLNASCLALGAQVKARQGVISSLALHNGVWDVNDGLLTADRVFLATGSHPRDDQLYPDLTTVPLDDALIPSKLSGALCCLNSTVCLTQEKQVIQDGLVRNHHASLLNLCSRVYSESDTSCMRYS